MRHDNGFGGQGYDSHRDHLEWARTELLPPTDAAFASLVEDLHQRGLLDETLIVVMGEFGRTPRLGQVTSDAGAANNGRDHWPFCYTVLLAGGGIRGGTVFGASDRWAAYPARDPVTPADLAATVYHLLGIDPALELDDPLGRPLRLCDGTPIRGILEAA